MYSKPLTPSLRRLLKACRASSRENGLIAQKKREARWYHQHQELAKALDSTKWKDVHKIEGSSSYQRHVLYQVKSDRISRWDVRRGQPGFPHDDCEGAENGGTAHFCWECPVAQTVWKMILTPWITLGVALPEVPSSEWIPFIFGLRAPDIPRQLWLNSRLASKERTEELVITLRQCVELIWQLQVLNGLVALKVWRAQSQAGQPWNIQACQAQYDRNMQVAFYQQLWKFRQSQGDSAQCAIDCLRALQDVICSSLAEVAADDFSLTASVSSEITILLFDGGSRGNPGPGGAGSVLVKVCPRSRSARIIWFGSMSYAESTTTNNSAEYQGLIHGLRAAHKKQIHQLEVIGDSAMILRQMRLYRPPKKERLRELYAEARYLGDMICIKRWHHHFRRHNKMADLAAIFAMDRRLSVQTDWPTDRSSVPAIEELLVNDLVPWFAQAEDQSSASTSGEDPA